MSEMNLIEITERFDEGLKKAASRMRELAVAQNHNDWRKLAFQLDKIRGQGMDIIRSKGMTRQETLGAVDRVQEVMKTRIPGGQGG